MRTFLTFLLGIVPLSAQNIGIDQPSDFVTPPSGGKFLRWYGKQERTYFVQVSSDAEPLQKWSWAPIIETGNNQTISHEVFGSAPRGFFRLKYTDDLIPAEETPDTADFDSDELENYEEITGSPQTDPLNADTDSDGMPDGWEKAHGLNGNDSADAAYLFPGTNLTNLQAYNAGVQANANATPTNKDGDDLDDIEDADPNDKAINWKKTPAAEFIMVDVTGWDAEVHGNPVTVSNTGTVLCEKAVWADGTWTTLNKPATLSATYKCYIDHYTVSETTVEKPCYIHDIRATGILPDGKIVGVADTYWTDAYAGDEGRSVDTLPIIWSSAGAVPVLLGLSSQLVIDLTINSDHYSTKVASNPTGDVCTLVQKQSDTGYTLTRFAAGANGLTSTGNAAFPVSQNHLYKSLGYRPHWVTGPGGCVAAVYWDAGYTPPFQPIHVWPSTGSSYELSDTQVVQPAQAGQAVAKPFRPAYGPVFMVGETPKGDPILNINSNVLIGNEAGTKWTFSPTLGGIDRMSKYGTGIRFYGSTIWRNGETEELEDVCTQLQGRTISQIKSVEINDYGAILATADEQPNEGEAFETLILLIPVEVVNKDKAVVNELEIGRMADPGVLSNSGTLVIDDDSDRFFIRIRGAARCGTSMVKIASVDNTDPNYNDDETELELKAKDGDLISKSLLLVSDDVDDDVTVDGSADDAKNDRTHKIQLEANLKISAIKIGTNPEKATEMKVPVKVKKTVNVKMVNCRYGLLDIESCWPAGTVTRVKRVMKERYAQVGVKLEITDAVGKVIDWTTGYLNDYPTLSGGVITIPQQSKDIIDATPASSSDEIGLYLVRKIHQGPNGVSILPKFTSAADKASGYSNKAFVEIPFFTLTRGTDYTAAHEALHLLLDSEHRDYATEFGDSTMLWHDTIQNDTIDDTKRISANQETKVLTNPLAK